MTWMTGLKTSLLTDKPVPLTLFSAKIAGTTAPVDTVGPPYGWSVVGDGTTDLNGDAAAPQVGTIRCDGWRSVALTIELFVSSGSGTATFRPYFFDGARWVKCGDVLTFTSSQTSSVPAARERHDICVENDYGFCLVLESISGTNATAAAWAQVKDALLGRH